MQPPSCSRSTLRGSIVATAYLVLPLDDLLESFAGLPTPNSHFPKTKAEGRKPNDRSSLNVCEPAADTSCMRQVPLIDRLLLWPFGVARNLFFLQGLAFGCASAATFAWTRSDVSPWLTRSLVVAALISGTFVVAGFLLSWMRSWTPTRDRWSDPAESVWPTRLTVSLVLISGLTMIVSGGLPGLWRQILAQLSAIDFWNGLTTPSQFGGIVILPILLALFVPLLVTVAAVFSFVFPLVLLARLRFRPLMFPTMLSMGAVCQSALVATGWLATMLLRELTQAFNAAMLEAPNAEVVQVSDQLARAVSTLMTTATMLVLPAAVLVGWAVFLRPSSNAAGQFGRDEAPGTVELPNLEANYKEEPFVAFSAEAVAPKSSMVLPGHYAGWALMGLGVLMLMFAAMDSLRSRPAYVTSTPAPGASAPAAPPAIQVTFSGALDSASMLSLVYLPEPGIDDISRDVPVTSRLASSDPEGRTLEVIPPRLGRGLYLVRWTAYPDFGGVIRNGSFVFGVGVAVPPDTDSDTYSLRERDSGDRGRRSTLLGGVLLLVIGGLSWYRFSLLQ